MNVFMNILIFFLIRQYLYQLKNVLKIKLIIQIIQFLFFQRLEYIPNKLILGSHFKVKIGKDIDNNMKIFFYIILGISLLINIFLSFTKKRVLRNIDGNNVLLNNFLINHISDFLLVANIANCLSFFFFMGKSFEPLMQYLLIVLIGLFKSGFYTLVILLLKGWLITTLDNLTSIFQVYYKRLLFYELLVSLFLYLSVYLFNFSNKLYLFNMKRELEQSAFFVFLIYCFCRKLGPLYRQMIYEQIIHSESAEPFKFKYKLLLEIYIIFEVHASWMVISPIIEMELTFDYLYEYQLHFIFYLFYEGCFFLALNLLFMIKRLSLYNYGNNIYLFQKKVIYEADISGGNDEQNHNKNLNISKLTSNQLKKISKEENFPIILMNPFASSKDQHVINHLYLGVIQKIQEN